MHSINYYIINYKKNSNKLKKRKFKFFIPISLNIEIIKYNLLLF